LLHEHFAAKAKYREFEFNTNSIMLLLVISRILPPGSKKKAFEEKGRYFKRFGFELADVYRALPHFSEISADVQKFLHGQIAQKYGRGTSVVYFDTLKLASRTIFGRGVSARGTGRTRSHRWGSRWTKTACWSITRSFLGTSTTERHSEISSV
jgi:hypothetical protein